MSSSTERKQKPAASEGAFLGEDTGAQMIFVLLSLTISPLRAIPVKVGEFLILNAEFLAVGVGYGFTL
jgi:hypothetical protein